jgi:hypothetical protein
LPQDEALDSGFELLITTSFEVRCRALVSIQSLIAAAAYNKKKTKQKDNDAMQKKKL